VADEIQWREVTEMIGLNGKLSILVLTLGCVSAFAQNSNAPVAGSPGCGDSTIKFNVKMSAGQATVKPEAGDALVYVIQDDSNFDSITKPTTKTGLDGKWVGATHGDSFFSFNVAPGVHHVCASWQTSKPHPMAVVLMMGVRTGSQSQAAADSFTAEAGGVYYFVVKDTVSMDKKEMTIPTMELSQVNSDEGQLLVNGRAVASSKQK
jgi:hypothetical protein